MKQSSENSNEMGLFFQALEIYCVHWLVVLVYQRCMPIVLNLAWLSKEDSKCTVSVVKQRPSSEDCKVVPCYWLHCIMIHSSLIY